MSELEYVTRTRPTAMNKELAETFIPSTYSLQCVRCNATEWEMSEKDPFKKRCKHCGDIDYVLDGAKGASDAYIEQVKKEQRNYRVTQLVLALIAGPGAIELDKIVEVAVRIDDEIQKKCPV